MGVRKVLVIIFIFTSDFLPVASESMTKYLIFIIVKDQLFFIGTNVSIENIIKD